MQANSASVDGWRGLFLAQVAAGNAPLALATDKRVPAAVHAQLMRDPAYLRALASSYSAVGRDPEAQKALEAALQLPFPADAKKLKSDMQIQLANILLASNHLEQAATLYSQVLALDHGNTAAWQGLVRVQHGMGHDQEALATVEGMPPSSYAVVMRDPGFEATVAAIYQAEKKLDVAQDLLEKALAEQTSAGQKPSAGMEMQLAGLHLERGDPKLATPIYQQLLTDDPNRVDAWAGLISSLHAVGNDKEAAAQAQRIPAAARAQLESHMNYLQTMGSVYQALGQSQQALVLLNRVQQYYAAQHTAPPVEIDIQNAWLLYNSQDESGLYRQLMNLGGRSGLSQEQSRTVQAIWTNWAVRRANQTAAAGNTRHALAILNAAARAFPDNPAVLRTLANGYARAGQPEQAVLIYKSQNLISASVEEYEAAVGAALESGENKVAETWLHYAMAAFPNDPRILILGARFEQARGDTAKAIDYYRASLKALPPLDRGAELAAELRLPAPTESARLPSAQQAQDLSILLAPGNTGSQSGAQTQPSLPSFGYFYALPNGQAPAAPNSLPNNSPSGVVPPYMTSPTPIAHGEADGEWAAVPPGPGCVQPAQPGRGCVEGARCNLSCAGRVRGCNRDRGAAQFRDRAPAIHSDRSADAATGRTRRRCDALRRRGPARRQHAAFSTHPGGGDGRSSHHALRLQRTRRADYLLAPRHRRGRGCRDSPPSIRPRYGPHRAEQSSARGLDHGHRRERAVHIAAASGAEPEQLAGGPAAPAAYGPAPLHSRHRRTAVSSAARSSCACTGCAGPFNGPLVQRTAPRHCSQHTCASSGPSPGPHLYTCSTHRGQRASVRACTSTALRQFASQFTGRQSAAGRPALPADRAAVSAARLWRTDGAQHAAFRWIQSTSRPRFP